MNNQSSPVQILSPVIPSSWCPSGSFADIFNSYNQLYLNNSTINIPFLNEVTPQQITALQQSILTITNQLNAVNYQSGTQTITASNSAQTFTITIPTAMANSSYQISGYFTPTAGTANASASWGIVTGSQTSTQFKIWILSNNSDITSFTWQVSNLGSL